MDHLDPQIIKELKSAILQSRYHAARLVNKELIGLYFQIGKKISVNTKKMAWGSKVLEQISSELQKELPGLKGFSAPNLKKMRGFSDFWSDYGLISSTVSNQLNSDKLGFSSTVSNQLGTRTVPILSDQFLIAFFKVSFSHHYLIATKSNFVEEAQFYIQKAVLEFWSYRTLQHHIKSNLYKQKGTLPNNFEKILPLNSSNKALQIFKDEYLLDFINIEDPDEEDERLIENEIVRNIKKFILTIGNDFAFMGNQYRNTRTVQRRVT